MRIDSLFVWMSWCIRHRCHISVESSIWLTEWSWAISKYKYCFAPGVPGPNLHISFCPGGPLAQLHIFLPRVTVPCSGYTFTFPMDILLSNTFYLSSRYPFSATRFSNDKYFFQWRTLPNSTYPLMITRSIPHILFR